MRDQHGKAGGLAGDEAHMGQDMHPECGHCHPEGDALGVVHRTVARAVGDLVGTVGHGGLLAGRKVIPSAAFKVNKTDL